MKDIKIKFKDINCRRSSSFGISKKRLIEFAKNIRSKERNRPVIRLK